MTCSYTSIGTPAAKGTDSASSSIRALTPLPQRGSSGLSVTTQPPGRPRSARTRLNIEQARRQARQLVRAIYTAARAVDTAVAVEQEPAHQDCRATVAPSRGHDTEP